MIRVTYVLGSHESRYTQHYKSGTVEAAQHIVDRNMSKDHFNVDIAGGFIRIYSSRVSAVEIRDITNEENIRLAALEAQRKEG